MERPPVLPLPSPVAQAAMVCVAPNFRLGHRLGVPITRPTEPRVV